MSMSSSVGSILNTSGIGAGWQPKSSRIRVGRDVGAVTSTAFCGQPDRNRVLGHGGDVASKSQTLFDYAKSMTQSGGTAQGFRKLAETIDELVTCGFGSKNPAVVKETVLQQKGDYIISHAEKGLLVYKKDAETGKYAQIDAVSDGQDVRIAWDGNGDPRIMKGGAALTNGILAAQGEDEFLFRASKVDVAAGKGTTVFNASSAAGVYSGGDNVTYLGSYEGGTFTETEGKVNFAGYFNGASFSKLTGNSVFSGVFEKASVDLQEGKSTFSGYFSASEIQAGKEGNTASGLFMNACIVKGGDGDDVFSGRFIDSEVDGGKGNDSFGNTRSMIKTEGLAYTSNSGQSRAYNALVADFVNTDVNAGKGDDTFKGVMWGGALNLEEGENTVQGMFGEATVNGGKDNDDIEAVYSHMSSFDTGLGDDKVSLVTATQSSVTTDEGLNLITLGKNNPNPADKTWQTRGEYFSKSRPMETGELRHNAVNSEKGDNTIGINNGESTVAVLNGNEYEEKAVDRETGDSETLEAVPARGAVEQPAASSARGNASPAMAQSAALLDPAKMQVGLNAERDAQAASPADKRTVRNAIGRYMNVYGFEPLAGDTPAVTVQSGPGESRTFTGVERHNTFEEHEKPGMMRVVRRYDGLGSVSWDRWTRLRA